MITARSGKQDGHGDQVGQAAPVSQPPAPTAAETGDLLRQLSHGVLDGPHCEAGQRLSDAATTAADWVVRGLIDRTAATTTLYVAGQVVGIGQAAALSTIRDAFLGPPQ